MHLFNRVTNQTDAELWKDQTEKDQYRQADEHTGLVGKLILLLHDENVEMGVPSLMSLICDLSKYFPLGFMIFIRVTGATALLLIKQRKL